MNILNKITKLLVATAIVGTVFIATAIPTFAASKHNVTFVYGTKVYSVTAKDGETVVPPVDTYVPGYVFAGWVGSSINVKSDVTILGAYVPATPAPAPVTYYNPCYPYFRGGATNEVYFMDGLTRQIYNTQVVDFGRSAKEPERPVHEGYHFAGYDGDFICVTNVRTIVAVYHKDNSNCECTMKERIDAEEKANQERIRQIQQQEEAERQAMLERVRQEEQAEQEMLRQLREKEEAERQAELERQAREEAERQR